VPGSQLLLSCSSGCARLPANVDVQQRLCQAASKRCRAAATVPGFQQALSCSSGCARLPANVVAQQRLSVKAVARARCDPLHVIASQVLHVRARRTPGHELKPSLKFEEGLY
jgi:hypothetical protein